jgi:Tol biopolymer transport system component
VRNRTGGRTRSTLAVLDVATGRETALVETEGSELVCPRWAPDGDRIVVARGWPNRNNLSWEMLLVDARTGKVSSPPGIEAGHWIGGFAWSGTGRHLVLTRTASVMGDLSGSGSRLLLLDVASGAQRTLLWAEGLAPVNGSDAGISLNDVLASGRLLIAQRLRRQNLREIALDGAPADARPRLLTEGSSMDRQPVYSPDGRHILFSSNRSGNLDLWLLERATGALRQVTDDAAQDWDPGFTPDGRHILWSSDRGGHLEIWMANADGSGARQVSHDGVDAENPTATPDGSWIVYWSGHPERNGVWKVRADGSSSTLLAPGNHIGTEVSGDGRFAAYVEQDRIDLRSTIKVVEIASGRAVPFRIDIRYRFGDARINWGRLRWSRDGRALYFVGRDDDGLSGVFAQEFAPGRDTSATRRKLAGFSSEYVTESLGLSPDGHLLTISTAQEFATLQLAEGVPGVTPPERRAP